MPTSTEKNKTIAIVLLTTALLLVIGFCLYLMTGSRTEKAIASGGSGNGAGADSTMKTLSFQVHDFIDPQDDDTTDVAIDAYRKPNETTMVTYDTTDILNYFRCVWPALTKKAPPTNYHWAVGFYFARKYDATKKTRRLSFCVIPTLVPPKGNTTLQPMEFRKYKAYYDRNPSYPCISLTGLQSKAATTGGVGNAYDAGQLWP